MVDKELDIYWIIEEEINVTKLGDNYVVQEVGGDSRQCVITVNDQGRMLFDGHDIETESFMGFVGMMDRVNEEAAGQPVHFDKD